MLSPGSKNWIKKYLELVEQGKIVLDQPDYRTINKADYLHARLFKTGLQFGYPFELIYANNLNTESWTLDEKLKVLLFESLIFIYVSQYQDFDYPKFEESLLSFYEQYNHQRTANILEGLFNEQAQNKLEKILSTRVYVKRKLSNALWSSFLSNSLVYLDTISFLQFITKKEVKSTTYTAYKKAVLQTIALASNSDGELGAQEKNLFNIFFSSSNLSSIEKKKILDSELSIEDIQIPVEDDKLFAYYLIDCAVLAVYSDLHALENEIVFLHQLCKYLKISSRYLKETMVLIETFVLENNNKVLFLQENNTYDRVYKSLSRRWIKILGRNKKKLVLELQNNRTLIHLVNKSLVTELTEEEKEKVKSQFMEVLKTMPALAIFMLPGGALLLPLILKIIPDLIPSAFKNNELEKNEAKEKNKST